MEAADEIDRLNERIHDLKTDNSHLRSDIELLRSEKSNMDSQLRSFGRVNEAVVNMLLEIKQRAGADQPWADPESVAAIRQRQALLSQNPHVTADQLRGQLRVLLASKDGYERNLKKALEDQEASWEQRQEVLETEIRGLVEFKTGSDEAMADVWGKVEEAEEAQAMVIEESRGIIEKLKADNHSMLETIKEKETEIENLKLDMSKKDAIIDQQDTELLQVSQLENQMNVLAVQNELAVKQAHAQSNSKLQELEKANQVLRRESQKAAGLHDKLKAAESEVLAYKNDIRRSKMVDSDKRVARFERAKNEQDKKLKKTEQKVVQLGLITDKTTQANLRLEKEYRKMFTAVKCQQKEMIEQEQRATRDVDVRKMAEQNPFYIDTYKRKLVLKDQEIDGLKAKLRRMTVSENRGAILRKTMQAERGKYENEISNLRSQLADLPSERPGTAHAVMRRRERAKGAMAVDQRDAMGQLEVKSRVDQLLGLPRMLS
eukprot:TRINITY_DN14678_c0_g1_i1.p1 TRINITY_DN14678_c0_g1~~TRINITY_DN14678_c0_g1_i1.p1  ORF type:complete len:489 (+),score=155.67 TRINITY_DN14678_c0_g1_i1:186-1652(+)